MSQTLIDQGIDAFVASNPLRARQLLEAGLKQDPGNERGWLALSFVVDTPQEEVECLHRVLALNPQNEQARERLEEVQASLGIRPSSQRPPPTAPAARPTPPEPSPGTPEPGTAPPGGEYFILEPGAEKFIGRGPQPVAVDMGNLNYCVWPFLALFVLGSCAGLYTVARTWLIYLWLGGEPAPEVGPMLASTGATVLLVAITLGLVYYFVIRARRRQRPAPVEELVTGEIVHCSGSEDAEGNFYLTAQVRFPSPRTGTWIQRTHHLERNDLKDRDLPQPGAQVHVLYRDDSTYQVL